MTLYQYFLHFSRLCTSQNSEINPMPFGIFTPTWSPQPSRHHKLPNINPYQPYHYPLHHDHYPPPPMSCQPPWHSPLRHIRTNALVCPLAFVFPHLGTSEVYDLDLICISCNLFVYSMYYILIIIFYVTYMEIRHTQRPELHNQVQNIE